ncbi:PhoU domain-containing protein, partial [Vibrio cholerae]|uniref:PhoU domain-containing protein n=1 Tax=Vibrio cholerae TaxID=666 RepID=UPI003080E989
WWVVPSDDKKRARLNCISHLLSSVEYQEIEHAQISLPEINKQDDRLDKEYEAVVRQLMTYMMEDPKNIPHILQVIWSARAIER